MPKKTYGPQIKKRVKRLLEALLCYVDGEFEYESFDIKHNNWIKEDGANPKLIVQTTLLALEWLTAKDKYPAKLTKTQIREALKLLDKDNDDSLLQILEDNRATKKGSGNWHFTLKLWSKDKQENLKRFDEVWENNRPSKSKVVEANYQQDDGIATTTKPKTGISQTSLLSVKSPRYIPHKGAATFVGRKEEMTLLHKKLQQSNAVAISAIAGMGGVGKTELATQYARQYEADYPGGICWLNARDTNLAGEIIQFYQFYVDNQREIPQEIGGRQLTVSEQAIWCWENWQPEEGLILVVWDDVTDLGSCQQLLPTNNRFCLLITTRLRNLDPNIVEEIPLDILSPEKSLELLTALVGKKRVEKEIQAAAELCKWLGYLPLGLDLVGRYVADDPDLSLQEMLESLKQQRLDDEALEGVHESWTTAQRGVLAAFELSWQKLDATTKQVAELLSLFAPDVIRWDLVTSTCQRLDWNKADINKAKKQLYKHYLIQPLEDKKSSYKIHPLIHQFLQVKLETTSSIDELKCAFATSVALLGKEIPEDPNCQIIAAASLNVPHVEEVAKHLTAYLTDDILILPFTHLGRFYQGQGLYNQAENIYELCLSIVEKRFTTEHPHLPTSLSHLSSIYRTQGRYKEAKPLCQKALQMRRELLGEEHTDVADSLNNLALLFQDMGEYGEAETLYQQALEMRRKLLGENHLDFTDSLHNLAVLYNQKGLYEKAKPLFIKALELRQELLDKEHPRIATSLDSLASCYYSLGLYEKAEDLYLQALELSRKILGETHHQVADILSNLAQNYAFQQKYQQAESNFIEALKQKKQILGEEHPEIAFGKNNLASFYEDIGNTREAESLYNQALEMRRRLLGNTHSDVAISLNNLAKFYYSQNRYTEAEPLYIESIDIIKSQLGLSNPHAAKIQSNLDELQSAMKNSENSDGNV